MPELGGAGVLELLEVLGALGVAQGGAGQDLRRGVVELALADQLGVRRARVLEDLVQLGLGVVLDLADRGDGLVLGEAGDVSPADAGGALPARGDLLLAGRNVLVQPLDRGEGALVQQVKARGELADLLGAEEGVSLRVIFMARWLL